MSRAENAYWRKKLPPGFRYMLEKIGRGVCKGRPQPANVVQYIATYLEFKQSEHAAELASLPKVSYVQKLLANKKRKEGGNITAEQEGTSVRAESKQASGAAAGAKSSTAAIKAKEPKGVESKKEVDKHTSEIVLVKNPAASSDDKPRSGTDIPQEQKSVLEILYPNTSTGKITAEHKKGQVRTASYTSRETIQKEPSKPIEIERQVTSVQYLSKTVKGAQLQKESKSVVKALSEPAVKPLSQLVVSAPSETSAPLVPNDEPSPSSVKVTSQSAVKDKSHSNTPQTFIEPSTGREQEGQAGAAVALINTQKETTHVLNPQTAEIIPDVKSQPPVKVPSDTFASQAPVIKPSAQIIVKSPSQPVVIVSSQSAVKVPSHSVVYQTHVKPSHIKQEETDKETIVQLNVLEKVSHVSQQTIPDLIQSSNVPSHITIQFQSESHSQQSLIEKAPSQLVVKSPSQPAVNLPSQTTVLVSTHSAVPHSTIKLSASTEQDSPAEKTVLQTEPGREAASGSQEQIVESVLAKKSQHVPLQHLAKAPSEPLIKLPSQGAIHVPSQLVVKTSQSLGKVSQAAVNVPSQLIASQKPFEPPAGRVVEEPTGGKGVELEVQREIIQVSHQQIAELIQTEKSTSQPVLEAISQAVIKSPSYLASDQEIINVPTLPAVNVASHLVVQASSQPTDKATSELIVQLSQLDVKIPSNAVTSHPSIESAEDREVEETVIRTEVLNDIAHVPQQQIAESILAVKPSEPVVNAASHQVLKVPSQPTFNASSHSVLNIPSQIAVKTSHTTVKVESQSVVPQATANPTAGREPEEAAEETTRPAELRKKVEQESQQQISESSAKTPLQPGVKALSQSVVNSPSRPAVKTSSQHIVKTPSHAIVKASSQPAIKNSQQAVKVSSKRIASRASVEQTTDRELEELAKKEVLQADFQRELSQVSQRHIAEPISTAKVASQQVVKTLSQPVIKATSRPTVKASSQHIVKVPSQPTVKVTSHSVLKAPSQPTVKATSQPTVKVPSQLLEASAGREIDETSKETGARIEVQREITQVSQQQLNESMLDGNVPSQLVIKIRSGPALEVPSQSIVKIPSQLISSQEPMELIAGERQPIDKTIMQTEESLRTDIPGQPIKETSPLAVMEVESTRNAEEIKESPLDQTDIISTQEENIGIQEVTQSRDENTKELDVDIDLSFEAETVSSLVAIKAEAEIEKEALTVGNALVDEHQTTALGDLVNETEIDAPQVLAEGTGHDTSLQKTDASALHLSFENVLSSVQETQSNEPEVSPILVPTDDTHDPAHGNDNESEIPVSHVATEDSVYLKKAPLKELEDSSQLCPEKAYLEKDCANDRTEQPKTTEAFVKEPDTASFKSYAEELNEEQSETSNVAVCHRRLSIEPTTTEAEGQTEVSETSKVVHPRRLSIDQATTEVEGEIDVSETSRDSLSQGNLPLNAKIEEDAAVTCVVDFCQRRLSIEPPITETETEANMSEDHCKAVVKQRRFSVESGNRQAETEAKMSETPSKESELQVSCPTLKQSTSISPVLEASSQNHDSRADDVPSKELQMPVNKLCSYEPETLSPKVESLSLDGKVPCEEPQAFSQAYEPPDNEAKAPIHNVDV